MWFWGRSGIGSSPLTKFSSSELVESGSWALIASMASDVEEAEMNSLVLQRSRSEAVPPP